MALNNSGQGSKKIYDVDQLSAMKYMKQIWQGIKKEALFYYCCSACLITSSTSLLKGSELVANSEIEKLKTHSLNSLSLNFQSTVYEMFIPSEVGCIIFKMKANSNLKLITITFSKNPV